MVKYKNKEKSEEELGKQAYRDVSKWLLEYTRDVNRMHSEGIKGLANKVRKEYVNGDGEEYSKDFLSFYQNDGVRYLIENKKILIADDMGVGKTAQAVGGKLEIENRSSEKIRSLVIVPNDLKKQWEERINEYCKRKQTTIVLDPKKYKSLGRILEDAKDADFIIANYEFFGSSKKNSEFTDRLIELGIDYVILDEVHNTKNPHAIRSSYIKKIADSSEYLCLLSGTPIPNNLRDTYMLISMLDPKTYPTAEHVKRKHKYEPGTIAAVLRSHRLKRKIEDIENLPPLEYNTKLEGVISLSPNQRKVYNAILENDTLEGGPKLIELRKALLDPSLVNPNLIYDPALRERLGQIESAKYKTLDKIIEGKTSKGYKVVVFSPIFKNGVTEKLEERYKGYGALRIDGDVPVDERKKIRDLFQKDPSRKVLIATSATTGEGVSLTAANVVSFLDEPYTPADKDQPVSRVRRRGQNKKVWVYSLAVKDSVDEGILELLKWKEEALDYLERGLKLTPEMLNAMLDKESKTTPIKDRIFTAQQKVLRYSIEMKMVGNKWGHERIERELSKNDWSIGRQYAELYLKKWNTSYSANTASAYKEIIKGLSNNFDLGRKLDLGSGPGIMSHVLGEPTVNVDLNPKNFEQKFAHPKSRNIVSSFHDLKKELADESFDLVVASLSLDYTSNMPPVNPEKKAKRSKKTERENSIREINRVLRKKGYLIVTMPHSDIGPGTNGNWSKAMNKLGLEQIPELSGFLRSATDDADFQVYLSVYQKTGNPSRKSVAKGLELSPKTKQGYKMRKHGVVKDFVFVDGENQESLEKRLKKYLERAKVKLVA